MPAVVRSRFHLFIGLFVAAVILLGFSRSYYLRPLFDRPPLTLLLHLHAAVFTAWIALFLVQVRLASMRRMDWHRRLGTAGGVVAVFMVVTTAACIVEAMRGGKLIGGVPAWQFVANSTISIGLFAGFVAAALALRRRPDWHRRLMTIATVGIIGPAVGRLLIMIGGVPAARYATWVVVAVLASCLAYDAWKHRIVHPAFALGTAILVAAMPLKRMLGQSQAWADFARWVISA